MLLMLRLDMTFKDSAYEMSKVTVSLCYAWIVFGAAVYVVGALVMTSKPCALRWIPSDNALMTGSDTVLKFCAVRVRSLVAPLVIWATFWTLSCHALFSYLFVHKLSTVDSLFLSLCFFLSVCLCLFVPVCLSVSFFVCLFVFVYD